MTDPSPGISVAPASPAGTPPGAQLQAVLVIHGVGQQQPFQPLDSFVNGLRATLRDEGKTVALEHFMHGREEASDHCVRVEASGPSGGPLTLRLDVYEFYWAPLTQRKASFVEIVRWLVATGLTPLRRFAFNLPLLIQRAQARVNKAQPPAIEGGGSGARWVKSLRATAEASVKVQFGIEFIRELWRVIYVCIAAVVLAGSAASLVSHSSALAKKLPEAFTLAATGLGSWGRALTATVAIVAAIAAIALVMSLPEQVRDLIRLRKLEPRPLREAAGTFRSIWASRAGEGKFLPGVWGAVKAGIAAVAASGDWNRWHTEVWARWCFILLSVAGLGATVSLCMWLVVSPDWCLWSVCPSSIVHDGLPRLIRKDLGMVLVLLIVAAFLKRVFVDYLGDVALYATADENSSFFQTRSAILREATRKLRALLRDPQYTSVAIAGHSLGSVIGYDAINYLRTEAKISARPERAASAPLDELTRLLEKLPSQEDMIAGQKHIEALKGAGGAARDSTNTPISDKELNRLTAFITFGSPLNKVLYFFRTKVKPYETVRGHIVRELHDFHQLPDLITRDPEIRDAGADDPVVIQVLTAIEEWAKSEIHWVNVYSPMDPVSARLVLYQMVEEHRRWFWAWGKCHVSYWHDPKFYRVVMGALQGPKPAKAEIPAK